MPPTLPLLPRHGARTGSRGPLTVPRSRGGHGTRGPGLGSARAPGVTPSACVPRGRLRPAWAIVQVCPGTEVARLLRPTPARRPCPPPSVLGPVHGVVPPPRAVPAALRPPPSLPPLSAPPPHLQEQTLQWPPDRVGQPSPWGARGCLCKGFWALCGPAGWGMRCFGPGHPALLRTMWQPRPGRGEGVRGQVAILPLTRRGPSLSQAGGHTSPWRVLGPTSLGPSQHSSRPHGA